MIVTDVNQLTRSSEPVSQDQEQPIIDALKSEIPDRDKALGLAAPQIGLMHRVFIARLSVGEFAFVNPEITWRSNATITSTEGCLSLPGVSATVERNQQVKIVGKIINLNTDAIENELKLNDLDACVVQHEMDHLDGVLIINKPTVKTQDQKYQDRQKKRQLKLNNRRKVKS